MGDLNCKNCIIEKEDKSLEIVGKENQKEIINIEEDYPQDSDIRQYPNNQIYNEEIQPQKEIEIEEEEKVQNEEKKEKIENEKQDQDDEEKREEIFEEEEEENDIMNAFGKTVIQTIYNKENNNNNNAEINDINNNLNNYNKSSIFTTTASKEGAIDLSNIQILNSAESNQNFINSQQEYFTNNPPDNININSNNNLPSSIFIENNPYNQYYQNEDLENLEVKSYRVIQNGENLPNVEQNELGTHEAGIVNSNNFNLDNNITQYNPGKITQNGNEYINNNFGDEQIMNNQIYYSNDAYNKSSANFGNQEEITNNNNNF